MTAHDPKSPIARADHAGEVDNAGSGRRVRDSRSNAGGTSTTISESGPHHAQQPGVGERGMTEFRSIHPGPHEPGDSVPQLPLIETWTSSSVNPDLGQPNRQALHSQRAPAKT